MTTFTPDQWLILGLAFALGLFLGMALLASPKWKQRYREEVRRREAAEAENAQLRRDANEMDSLRTAAARDEARRRTDTDNARTAATREEVARAPVAPRTDTVVADVRHPPEEMRAEADRIDETHPGEAESLRRAAERDEERRRAETRPL
ncbi:MAG TPA: hypothetical protein VIT38_15040 [Allosphingosinicella sp.]|jgi:hypothetical protein